MDTLSKLQALLPENEVPAMEENSPWAFTPKPVHLYERTDSDDDEEVTRQGRISQSQMASKSWSPATEKGAVSDDEGQPPPQLSTNQLELGQLAIGAEAYCPWQAIKKFPYIYLEPPMRDEVANRFWDARKIYNQEWDFYYIHRHTSDINTTPILLVPTKQFTAFLMNVNQTLKIDLSIPSGNSSFQVTFENDGTPQPRYLGRSTEEKMASNLHEAVPPHWYKPKNETSVKTPNPTDRSVAAFKAKMDLIAQAQKGKKAVNTEKKRIERIAKQQTWNHSTKRVQRYLGLRQASDEKQIEINQARVYAADSGLQWGEYSAAVKAAIPRSVDFNPDRPAPYEQEADVVFVCVDIEANERNSTQITEIGISTLDTRDLKGLVPGERGANWMNKIRARHFRINEYKHITNKDFVSGCPDRYEFGDSEFVGLRDAPRAVADCFKHPFSGPEELSTFADQNAAKRNIILVGHGVGADVTYLKTMGYDVHNLSNLQEMVDTAVMWQSLKREISPRNLGSILAELDIAGWNLHNAGNDAAYTLRAMIGISIRQLTERQKRQEDKDQEKKARIEEAVKEATQSALDREDGWSSGGENSDGGAPIAPIVPGSRRGLVQQPKQGSQCREGPWRQSIQNSGTKSKRRPLLVSGARPGSSNESWGQTQRDASTKSFPFSGTNSVPSNSSWEQTQPRSWAPEDKSLSSTSTSYANENTAEVNITPAIIQKSCVPGAALAGTMPKKKGTWQTRGTPKDGQDAIN